MKKLISIILVLTLICTLMVGCGSSAKEQEVYELNVSFTYGEASAGAELKSLWAIEEASEGRIKFNIYYSNSLVAIPDVPKALADGTADLAIVAFANYPSITTYSGSIMSMPFIGIQSNDQAARMWHDAYNELPQIQKELEDLGMVPWYTYVSPGTHLFFTDPDASVVEPKDLAGHKVMSLSISWQHLIDSVGGAAVGAPPPVYYENLSGGVADSLNNMWTVVQGFGIMDLVGASTEFGEQCADYSYFMMAMSKKTWDKLPEDLQALFVDADGSLATKVSAYKSENAVAAVAAGSETVNRTVLTEDQIAVWENAMAPFRENELAQYESDYGKTEVRAVYDWVINWLANDNA